VGIPFRRFVLWSRMRQAVASTQAGRDLTEAAVDAGFSDSAHLSRTFRAMFGLSPSMVLPLAEIVGSLERA
jgi:AraC-like DNA-binding protein